MRIIVLHVETMVYALIVDACPFLWNHFNFSRLKVQGRTLPNFEIDPEQMTIPKGKDRLPTINFQRVLLLNNYLKDVSPIKNGDVPFFVGEMTKCPQPTNGRNGHWSPKLPVVSVWWREARTIVGSMAGMDGDSPIIPNSQGDNWMGAPDPKPGLFELGNPYITWVWKRVIIPFP